VTGGRPPASAEPHWQRLLATAIRDGRELLARLGLEQYWNEQAVAAAREFGVFAPAGYVAKMVPGDWHDPLLRQVLPLREELEEVPGFTRDPLAEADARRSPGVLHKYHGRALMIATGACAIHCRYCFRRHYPYSESPRSPQGWEEAIRELAEDGSIDEVILSGGDPLTIVDSQLAQLVERLARIPHVRRLRVHTRLPIVIPERVAPELLEWLTGTRLAPIMVVHANHPRELDGPVLAALMQMVDAGVPVLNQAVLLRGVNDDAAVLAELCLKLVNHRVLPYYLHQLDRVAGAAHFEVPVERGRQLMAELRRRLPGYAVPRYVCEMPGAASKVPLESVGI
jgi:EF-P beta-lysylation protein EpmB